MTPWTAFTGSFSSMVPYYSLPDSNKQQVVYLLVVVEEMAMEEACIFILTRFQDLSDAKPSRFPSEPEFVRHVKVGILKVR